MNSLLQVHPGTKVFVTDRFGGWSSLRPMWHQVLEIGSDILDFMVFHPDGVNLIGDVMLQIISVSLITDLSDRYNLEKKLLIQVIPKVGCLLVEFCSSILNIMCIHLYL